MQIGADAKELSSLIKSAVAEGWNDISFEDLTDKTQLRADGEERVKRGDYQVTLSKGEKRVVAQSSSYSQALREVILGVIDPLFRSADSGADTPPPPLRRETAQTPPGWKDTPDAPGVWLGELLWRDTGELEDHIIRDLLQEDIDSFKPPGNTNISYRWWGPIPGAKSGRQIGVAP